jgi:hypothetical protein
MTKKLHDEFDLDALFANEKADDISPSDTLMAAIMNDADVVHTARQKTVPAVQSTRWWQEIVRQLGGWQAVSAFATCACIGMYLGYSSSGDQILGLVTSQDNAVLSDVFDSFSVASEFEISFLEG